LHSSDVRGHVLCTVAGAWTSPCSTLQQKLSRHSVVDRRDNDRARGSFAAIVGAPQLAEACALQPFRQDEITSPRMHQQYKNKA
jgi:hypothetical protein